MTLPGISSAYRDLPVCPEVSKRSYPGRDAALRWIRRKERGRRPRPGYNRRRGWRPPHRAYRCPFCGYWHLTHKHINRTDRRKRNQRDHCNRND